MGWFGRRKRNGREEPTTADAPEADAAYGEHAEAEAEAERGPDSTGDGAGASRHPPPTDQELADFAALVDPAAAEPPRQGEPRSREEARRRGISSWVEERAHRVVRRAYESHAGDLEERARRVMSSMYERTADDLEERAVRAMRRALESEAERIKDAIEHAIEVKKREVRLSLIVLVVSALVYLLLYLFTNGPAPS